MKKRVLSILLCLCMAITLLPTAALAAGTSYDSWEDATAAGDQLAKDDQITIGGVTYTYQGDGGEGISLAQGDDDTKNPLTGDLVWKAKDGYVLYRYNGSGEASVTLHNATIANTDKDGTALKLPYFRGGGATGIYTGVRTTVQLEGTNKLSGDFGVAHDAGDTIFTGTGTGTLVLQVGYSAFQLSDEVKISDGAKVTMGLSESENNFSSFGETLCITGAGSQLIIGETVNLTATDTAQRLQTAEGGTLVNNGTLILFVASALTIENKGTLENNGTIQLKTGTTPAQLAAMNLTGTGSVQVKKDSDEFDTYLKAGDAYYLSGGDVSKGLDLKTNTPTVTTAYLAGTGTALWEPVMEGETLKSAKLTLTDAKISASFGDSITAVSLPNVPVTVVLKGTNSIASLGTTVGTGFKCGAATTFDLTTGSETTVIAGGSTASYALHSIQADSAITISGTGALKLGAIGLNQKCLQAVGICANGNDVNLTGGTLSIAFENVTSPYSITGNVNLGGVTIPEGETLDLTSDKSHPATVAFKGGTVVNGTLVLDTVPTDFTKLTGIGMIKVLKTAATEETPAVYDTYTTDGTKLHFSTTALVFTAEESKGTLDEDGYAWNAETNTLTLKNLNLTVSSGNAITLPDADCKLVLEGISTVISEDGVNGNAAIYQSGETGSLTVSGTGILKVGGGVGSLNCILAQHKLVIESGTILKATDTDASIQAGGEDSPNGILEIRGGIIDLDDSAIMTYGKLTISGGTVNVGGLVVYGTAETQGKLSVSGGTVTVDGAVDPRARGSADLSSVMTQFADISITGGTLAISQNSQDFLPYGMFAASGNISITGGTVKATGTNAAIAIWNLGMDEEGKPSDVAYTLNVSGMDVATTPTGGTEKTAEKTVVDDGVTFTQKFTTYTVAETLVWGENESFPTNGCPTVSLTKTPVTPPSNGGGSGSGGAVSGGTTPTNPDGSKTTTTTDKTTGTVTETTTAKDGSTTIVETKKDGSVTTTDKAASGVTTVTKTDKDGNTTASVNVPSNVKDDVSVNLPADLGKTDGEVSVVVTYPDGTKETVTGKYENGKVNVTVSGSATIEILDDFVPLAAMPDFADVGEKDWFYEAVKYACEHGLFAGTSDTTFSPKDPMTRAMLWTVLGRLDGQDLSGKGIFDAAKAWATDKGITDGTNPDGSITREQLVTILWRYAGSPKVNGNLSAFTDSDSVASYAKDAMAWAVENNIVAGAGGKLMPTGNATRAQVAAILMRYCQNVVK